ncbi:MAG TPA: glycosyltransferase family 2 protein [Candidatus Saccharimonadales bacterium]|nr:glycosyltransferase family 2 protein [Candidatus Saccharimonadales bacterium]
MSAAEASPSAQPQLAGKLSLVIPVHNEAANMARVIPAALQALALLSRSYEIVLVDDGSSDATVEVARTEMGTQADRLRLVSHPHKSGYGITVADGLRAADGDWVAFIDGDGQFDPLDLRLLAEVAPSADLIAGWRIHREDPWHRSVVSGTFNVLVRLLYGISYRDVDCGFKLMRRQVLELAKPILAHSALLNTELYFKAERSGLTIRQVGITHHRRIAGVRSGGKLIPILRAIRELVRLRLELARSWHPPAQPQVSGQP